MGGWFRFLLFYRFTFIASGDLGKATRNVLVFGANTGVLRPDCFDSAVAQVEYSGLCHQDREMRVSAPREPFCPASAASDVSDRCAPRPSGAVFEAPVRSSAASKQRSIERAPRQSGGSLSPRQSGGSLSLMHIVKLQSELRTILDLKLLIKWILEFSFRGDENRNIAI